MTTFKLANIGEADTKGITYNFKKGTFLTCETDPLFECIADLAALSEDPKNKQGSISAALSRLVGTIGRISNRMSELLEINE